MSRRGLSLVAGGICLGVLAAAPAFGAALKGALSSGDSVFDSNVSAAAPSCNDNSDCGNPNRYCAKEPGNCDGQGVCRRRPNICPQIYAPVCGCDGQTYGNKCLAAAAGVNVDHEGECAELCGGFAGIPCSDPGDFCKTAPGECCCDFFGVCTPIPDACPDVWDPVCGCDGMTYGNECEADAAGISVDYEGECGTGKCCTAFGCVEVTEEECEALCGTFSGVGTTCGPFGTDCPIPPIFVAACCLPDKTCIVTTECICTNQGGFFTGTLDCDEAQCANGAEPCGGITGIPCSNPDDFCKTQPGECCCDFLGQCTPIPDACPDVWDPVCGCDGMTYGNECEADAAGVSVDYEGECGTGKCCYEFGCIETTQEGCDEVCGNFAGVGTVCTGTGMDCPEPPIIVAACCLPGGSCDVLTQCQCEGAGGVWQNTADCSAVDCPGGGQLCGGITGIPCENPNEFCKTAPGECCCDFFGECTPIPFACPLIYDPVCGCDGQTYTNECFADSAGVSVDFEGPCEGVEGECQTNADCFLVNYPFDSYCAKPVGQCDGTGECQIMPQLCLDVWDPVCGCDGQIYSNACYAARAGVNLSSDGACAQ